MPDAEQRALVEVPAEAYHNRAIAYYYLKEYDKAWADVRMCRQLGGTPNADFLANLMKVTGRKE